MTGQRKGRAYKQACTFYGCVFKKCQTYYVPYAIAIKDFLNQICHVFAELLNILPHVGSQTISPIVTQSLHYKFIAIINCPAV